MNKQLLAGLLITFTLFSCNAGRGERSLLDAKLVRVLYPDNAERAGGGTGFFIHYKGKDWLVTNAHICEGQKDGMLKIYSDHFNTGEVAFVEYVDKANDLCVLSSNFVIRGFDMADYIHVNEPVTIIGYPELRSATISRGNILGTDTAQFVENVPIRRCRGKGLSVRSTVLFGALANICVRHIPAYYTDAKVYPGSSGSPVLGDTYDLKGIVFASSRLTSFGLFIPMHTIKKALDAIQLPIQRSGHRGSKGLPSLGK